jgi:hypothetical protein
MKCDNDSEIDNFFNPANPKTIFLYYKDNYINTSNYKSPMSHYYYRYENTVEKDRYQKIILHFAPASVKTNDGLLYDNIHDNNTLIFEKNDIVTENKNNFDIYMGYRFNLLNTGYSYERNYEKVQDLLSSIGGVFNVIKIVFYYINIIVSDYITLSDTRRIISDFPLIKKHNNKYLKHKNIQRDLKQKLSMDLDLNNKADSFRNKFISKDLTIEKENNITDINLPRDDYAITADGNEINDETKNKRTNTDDNSKNSKNKIEHTPHKQPEINHNHFNWRYYIWHIITCGSKVSIFKNYENFRMKILSEEQLIKSYLDVNDVKNALLNV